ALHPNDEFALAQYAFLLCTAGHVDAARAAALPLTQREQADGLALYTVATIFLHLQEWDLAARMLERAIDRGFAHVQLLRNDPNFQRVAERPEFSSQLARLVPA